MLLACQDEGPRADLLIVNGTIETMSDTIGNVSVIAVKNDKIVDLGNDALIEKWQGDETEVIDANGSFVMPGFIEGHGHFSGLGNSLQILDFLDAKSWQDIIDLVQSRVERQEPGTWILGSGWHQEKWTESPDEHVHGYPLHQTLSEISPENPVLLYHASGHALYANKAAMDVARINRETPDPSGGEIVRDVRGEAIGVFEENAQGLIRRAYQAYESTLADSIKTNQWYEGIKLASDLCISKGITSFQDAGSSFEEIERFKQLATDQKLDLRLWVMILQGSEVLEDHLDEFPLIGLGNNYLTVRAIKAAIDGALGSFGAWLLDSYSDKPDFVGQNTTSIEEVSAIADLSYKHGLQMCVHAIGDRANREVLDIYQQYYNQGQDNLRWRIEHAQHMHPSDISRMAEMGVVAAMQAIHCTSDAPFVEKRLGLERSRDGAYAWRSILDAGGVIANGTDAPVEKVDPLPSLYASVTRQRVDNGMVFFPEQSMTRGEALRSYTIDAAYAAFEEDVKGSLEIGKLADIVIMDTNLRTCQPEDILNAEVLYTVIGGQVKYEKK